MSFFSLVSIKKQSFKDQALLGYIIHQAFIPLNMLRLISNTENMTSINAVSYTHLTLPTILLV